VKPHATKNQLKRLDRVKQKRRGKRTVAAWPKMMGVKEWSALAMPLQAQLIADTRDETHGVEVEYVGPDPADVTHRYKVSPGRIARPG
jgi:hypothetical protein